MVYPTGYHVSSSAGEEEEGGERWESRHLLQEVYDNESRLFPEPAKNCTEPGEGSGNAAAGTPKSNELAAFSPRSLGDSSGESTNSS
ncbi:hypothetical protein EYF80_056743 [Liparis tanakae]|uniref:Uncharacterized protein n=1 Tax=Liparis tanakae TaxID=230148 RepID=A0A4Z2EWY7_9TELE|nr:hypothetical protein EYF80_056743 [Liparis tanakae]